MAVLGLDKRAVTVEPGGLPSRLTAGTIGRLNPASLLNLVLSRRAYLSANKGDRPDRHRRLAEAMAAARPDELADTVVRLEGTDLVDDVLWKRHRGDGPAPGWAGRIGGRVWQNPRTSVAGKLLGTVAAPTNTLLANLGRSSHYNPTTDAATVYGDVPAVTTHELGHAIDFNGIGGKDPGLGDKLKRDAYMGLYAVAPPARLWHEGMANRKSRQALEEGLADDPDALHEIMVERDRALPAGYGSYVGGALGPLTGSGGSLAGLVAGKVVGMGLASNREKSRPAAKAASVLGDAALGAGAGAGLGFAGSSLAGADPILPLVVGGVGGAGLGALHGLGTANDAAAARQAKLQDDRAKRDEALADDMVKRQRGVSETFLTKYVMPRLAEQQGLVPPKAVKAAAVARLLRLVKSAGPYEGVDQHAHYSHMPVGKKRDLTPEEEALVAQGQSRWLPKLFPSYATPPHELMASPLKSGLIGTIPGGLVGAGLGGIGGAMLGGILGKATGHDQALSAGLGAGAGAAGLGLLGAGLGGVTAGLSRRAENENILDMMKRLPPGATNRDLMSDPAYQTDLDRAHSARNTETLGNSLVLASLLRD